jgi:hypothetical protein
LRGKSIAGVQRHADFQRSEILHPRFFVGMAPFFYLRSVAGEKVEQEDSLKHITENERAVLVVARKR